MNANCFKKLHRILTTTLLLFLAVSCSFCQGIDDAKALVKKGAQLIDQKKYAEAVDTLNLALKIDSENVHADYQLAVAFNNLSRSKEAILHLQKVIKANTNLNAAAYDLLGFTYFKNKEFALAEQCAVEELKNDPKQAGIMRMYALVSFHQNKRAQALLAFCKFILLEPETARSAEALGNIRHIIAGGTLKAEAGITLNPLNSTENQLNSCINKAVIKVGNPKQISQVELLESQLKNIFIDLESYKLDLNNNNFFAKNFVDFFYKLAASEYMPAFARQISLSIPESQKWTNEHVKEMKAFSLWINTSEN